MNMSGTRAGRVGIVEDIEPDSDTSTLSRVTKTTDTSKYGLLLGIMMLCQWKMQREQDIEVKRWDRMAT